MKKLLLFCLISFAALQDDEIVSELGFKISEKDKENARLKEIFAKNGISY